MMLGLGNRLYFSHPSNIAHRNPNRRLVIDNLREGIVRLRPHPAVHDSFNREALVAGQFWFAAPKTPLDSNSFTDQTCGFSAHKVARFNKAPGTSQSV